MPPRLVSVAILLYWVVAASSLIRRDVLPELGFVRPPDLRTIADAEKDAVPVRWVVEVIDNPLLPENRRPVGEAITHSSRDSNGWVTIASKVWFDPGRLLKGTPLASRAEARLEILNDYLSTPRAIFDRSSRGSNRRPKWTSCSGSRGGSRTIPSRSPRGGRCRC